MCAYTHTERHEIDGRTKNKFPKENSKDLIETLLAPDQFDYKSNIYGKEVGRLVEMLRV